MYIDIDSGGNGYMSFIYSLLENKIVVNIVAPIFCGIVVSVITERRGKDGKVFGTWVRKKIKNTTVRMLVVGVLSFLAGWMVFSFVSHRVQKEAAGEVVNGDGTDSQETDMKEETLSEEETLPRWTDDDGTEYTGNQKNGKIEGEGTAVYTNGEKYTGEFKAGLRDGEGTLSSASEEIVYDGAWKDNVKEGYGVEYFPDVNGRYEGEFKAGKREGDGVYYWESGDRYEGKWENDVRNGIGIFIGADGTASPEIWLKDEFVGNLILGAETWLGTDGTVYTGKKENGVLEGYGCVNYKGGTFYLGELKDGQPDGQGIMYYTNGDRYEGEWKNGVKDGLGTYCFKSSGSFHYGEWENGNRHGTGTYYNSSGIRYEGEWREDERSGKVIAWYPAEDERGRWYFEGEWEGSSFREGTMYYKNGTCETGIFQDDELVETTGEMNGILDQSNVTTWTDTDGIQYTGRQENGVLEGQGICIYTDGTIYIGEFVNGIPNGSGTEYYDDGDYYVGTFTDGQRNGTGVCYYSDNGESKVWYCGEWVNGKRTGVGIEYFYSLAYYEGECLNGERSGMGSMHYSDGVYYGEWQAGVRTGTGVFRGSDGSCYFGEYRDSVASGFGVMYYIDGSHYEGEWENGKRNGIGTEYDAEGNKGYYGVWVDGEKENADSNN